MQSPVGLWVGMAFSPGVSSRESRRLHRVVAWQALAPVSPLVPSPCPLLHSGFQHTGSALVSLASHGFLLLLSSFTAHVVITDT